MYECHVTTEYLGEENRSKFVELAKKFWFKMANLYMNRDEKSEIDSFFTLHNDDFATTKTQMVYFIEELKSVGIKVTRYKIEKILLDSKYENDPMKLLSQELKLIKR